MTAQRRAAFLDRDGVLNLDKGYVCRREQFVWVQNAPQALAKLKCAGYTTVLVTNQSGIARGMYDEPSFHALQSMIQQELSAYGAELDACYYCPHLPNGLLPTYSLDCTCRKPKPGMLLRAAHDLSLDLNGSLLIGDKASDMEAARAAGVRGWLFSGGDLLAFVEQVLAAQGSQ